MIQRFVAWCTMDDQRQELAEWVFFMTRRRIWEDLGHKTWAEYLQAHLNDPTQLKKARNAWDHLRRYHTTTAMRGPSKKSK